MTTLPLTYMKSARFGRLSTEQGLQRDELDPVTFLYVPTGHSWNELWSETIWDEQIGNYALVYGKMHTIAVC